MIGLADAVTQAVSDSATALTYSLRQTALASGWTRREAMGLAVTVDSDGLSIQTSPAAEQREYGTASEPPNAAVRRWAADNDTVQSILADFIDRRVQEVKS